MTAPKTTVWQLDPHTRAKHEILRRYLEAWSAILGVAGFKEILYIDGFAGPGRYAGGEEGSPILALRAALKHRDRIKATILFLFIERDEARAKVLEDVVNEIERPANFRVKVIAGKQFEEGFDEVFQLYASKGQGLPPTFAFIDPFGWTGIPFSLVKKILSYPSCEVLVNLMYEELNRFIGHPDQQANLDELFGSPDRRELGFGDKVQRRAAIHGLYQRQLGTAAKYVRSFEMRNDKDVTDYFLFFATSNLKGLKKMKEAMWRIDEGGEFTFSDATVAEQGLLFEKEPRRDVLERLIVAKFEGKQVTVDEVETFVVEETPFRETHYKKVLVDLERAGRVTPVNPTASRRPRTFGDGSMLLRFSK